MTNLVNQQEKMDYLVKRISRNSYWMGFWSGSAATASVIAIIITIVDLVVTK